METKKTTSNQKVEANECQGLQNTLTDNDFSSELWTSAEEMLIAAVQERPPLWNYKDCPPSQRTNAAKRKLWEEIESTINPNKDPKYNVIYFKNKWKNLYDTYRGYLAKEKTRSGQAAKPKRPWRFMDQMSFIRDTLDAGIKRTANSLPTDASDNIHKSDSESLNTSTEKPTEKKQKTDAIDKIAAALSMHIQMPQLNRLSLPIAAETNKDEINHFCATLDEKLHKLDTRKASLAMFKLYEILFKIENDLDI